MITKEGSTKIVYFMTPMARAWPYKPYSEYASSSTLSKHHIDCYCIKGL